MRIDVDKVSYSRELRMLVIPETLESCKRKLYSLHGDGPTEEPCVLLAAGLLWWLIVSVDLTGSKVTWTTSLCKC